ncbi:putative uncharacterized protein DDB_G0282133 isoform X8 [Glossina fuscipes]|uniref:Uncharacterized protein n=1 Tax=Glossina fuscipes TaxID=7396 RepID=A0A8U0WIF2_9MUSC|nr:putative uncharacterized protein DDB_G0282133 isoform X8 [Glossina fuscipes]
MPVSGFQYNARPYSSFRAARGNCSLQQQQQQQQQLQQPQQHQHQHQQQQQQQHQQQTNHQQTSNLLNNNHNNSIGNSNSKSTLTAINNSGGGGTATNNNNNNNHNNIHHIGCLATSASASAICVRNNNLHGGGNHGGNLSRQQPFRSSFYGTRYNHRTGENIHNNVNRMEQRLSANTTTTVKPLTPKLCRRIETACTATTGNAGITSSSNNSTSNHHIKNRAPAPPNNIQASNIVDSKQYLRARNNAPPTPPARKPTNFERFHQSNLSIRQKTGNALNTQHAVNVVAARDSHDSNQSKGSFNNGQQMGKRTCTTTTTTTGTATATANAVSKLSKENLPKQNQNQNGSHNAPIKSIKNYPAPLPPTNNNGTPKNFIRKKCKEEQKMSSISASPNLNNRRFISSVGINSFNAICCQKTTPSAARRKTYKPSIIISSVASNSTSSNNAIQSNHKTGSTGSNSHSSASSVSQGSPKTKKAFSNKFPQGLPFEDEFYRRYRSYSQSSSSNYSFYSPAGVPTTPHSHNYDDDDDDDNEDDEFQRKPSTDRSLYVDFSKVMQRSDYNKSAQVKQYTTRTTIIPTTTFIGSDASSTKSYSNNKTTTTTTTTNNDSSLSNAMAHSPQRRYSYNYPNPLNASLRMPSNKSKTSNSINDYLYTSYGSKTITNTNTTTTTTATSTGSLVNDSRKPQLYNNATATRLANIEDDFYSHATPEPSSQTQQTNIYLAVSSWAPKCSHPTKVLIPAGSDANNNNNNNRNYQNHARYSHGNASCALQYDQDRNQKYNNHQSTKGILELTNREYSFDSLSRRRKERSKRSHRKSPTSGRRVHKFRYREDASHSSSRRRHRDRAKDERDSGRNTRRSHSKIKSWPHWARVHSVVLLKSKTWKGIIVWP